MRRGAASSAQKLNRSLSLDESTTSDSVVNRFGTTQNSNTLNRETVYTARAALLPKHIAKQSLSKTANCFYSQSHSEKIHDAASIANRLSDAFRDPFEAQLDNEVRNQRFFNVPPTIIGNRPSILTYHRQSISTEHMTSQPNTLQAPDIPFGSRNHNRHPVLLKRSISLDKSRFPSAECVSRPPLAYSNTRTNAFPVLAIGPSPVSYNSFITPNFTSSGEMFSHRPSSAGLPSRRLSSFRRTSIF